MEITIQMIEQVIDATGADYYTVKNVLMEHDGNVEEAIRQIKEQIDSEKVHEITPTASDEAQDSKEAEETGESKETKEAEEKADGETGEAAKEEAGPSPDPFEELFSDKYAESVMDQLKKVVQAGNVDRIKISKEDGTIILDIPVNVGIISSLLGIATIPWAMILGILTLYGLKCKIEIFKSDGTVEKLM